MRVKVKDIKNGINYFQNFIIYKNEVSGELNICRNHCKHMGGKFAKCSNGSVVKCKKHGWELDLDTLDYTNPVGISQDSVAWTVDKDEIIIEDLVKLTTLTSKSSIEPIDVGEFKIKFYSHACMEVIWNSNSFFTDPWLVGPAFTKGWWLQHNPPIDWLEKIINSKGIYFSHNHSDHMNIHTLRKIVKESPSVPTYIPNFDNTSCFDMLKDLGFKNINIIDFQSSVDIDGMKFTMYQDTTDRDDSAILFDYKGHRILNTVDCKDIKSYDIDNVKVLLNEFSSGASGFPVCWSEQYSEKVIDNMVQKNRSSIKKNIVESIRHFKPELFVPFAGYFSELYPSDEEIRLTNIKNNPEDIIQLVENKFKQIKTWLPTPGSELDISNFEIKDYSGPLYKDLEKEFYVAEYKDAEHINFFNDIDNIQKYFDCVEYDGDLVLHIIETDENFVDIKNEFYVDFSNSKYVSTQEPKNIKRSLTMKVRSDIFRYVLFNGLPWEDISIGFQARFKRTPDNYNYDFWDVMQNNTPTKNKLRERYQHEKNMRCNGL